MCTNKENLIYCTKFEKHRVVFNFSQEAVQFNLKLEFEQNDANSQY
jgi:hypothetical protein